jgi:hypothetical protein
MRKPVLLRFASDTFMKDFASMIGSSTTAGQLATMVAQPEGFSAPPIGAPADWTPPPPPNLKVYQPIHGRFYLVAASVVCQLAGLPDRGVDKTRGEKVSFVLRRYDGTNEYAWAASDASAPTVKKWVQVKDLSTLVAGEELLPMFPVLYPEGTRKRRVHAGLIPTSNRETYQSSAAPPPVSAAGDPRVTQFENRVLGPYDQLLAPEPVPFVSGATYVAGAVVVNDTPQGLYTCTAGGTDASSGGPTGFDASITAGGLTWTYAGPAPDTKTVTYEHSVKNAASAFLLLDLADLLFKLLPTVWNAILVGPALSSTDPGSALYTALTSTSADTTGTVTWSQALTNAWQSKDTWQASDVFTNNDPTAPPPPAVPDLARSAIPGGQGPTSLRSLVTTALGPTPATPPPQPAPLVVPKIDTSPTVLYRIRCVFSRPNCGALAPDLLSDPSDPFCIAQFFDPDAPQRKIRIPLPVDTSVAGLRKFTPSVGFILAKQLRQQICRVTDLKKILDGNLADCNDPGLSLGEICSFSIPIITLCAMIVLMIFISLLNIIFWWMPFLKICIPVPTQPPNTSPE